MRSQVAHPLTFCQVPRRTAVNADNLSGWQWLDNASATVRQAMLSGAQVAGRLRSLVKRPALVGKAVST